MIIEICHYFVYLKTYFDKKKTFTGVLYYLKVEVIIVK